MTPDQFAKRMVEELDFPIPVRVKLIPEIATQIRTQLENHAEFALHPLFQLAPPSRPTNIPPPISNGTPHQHQPTAIPAMPTTNGHTPQSVPHTNGTSTPTTDPSQPPITATATLPDTTSNIHNPDDTYRCILTLSLNLHNTLYTDRFEYSLIHPPGIAESFARLTCADLALPPEWAMAITHAIYEAVLRLRKDIVENGGLPAGQGYAGDLDNDSAWDAGAGWRFAPEEGCGEAWEPRMEELTREEIEKREGDRERQLRRARRETARFTGVGYGGAGFVGGIGGAGGGGYFDQFGDSNANESERMGRGERRKTKRRFRSISPEGTRTPETGGAGVVGTLSDAYVPPSPFSLFLTNPSSLLDFRSSSLEYQREHY